MSFVVVDVVVIVVGCRCFFDIRVDVIVVVCCWLWCCCSLLLVVCCSFVLVFRFVGLLVCVFVVCSCPLACLFVGWLVILGGAVVVSCWLSLFVGVDVVVIVNGWCC